MSPQSARDHCLAPERVDAPIYGGRDRSLFEDLPPVRVDEGALHALGRPGGPCDPGRIRNFRVPKANLEGVYGTLHDGEQLGPVGGRIVGEVLVGIVDGDPQVLPVGRPRLVADAAGTRRRLRARRHPGSGRLIDV